MLAIKEKYTRYNDGMSIIVAASAGIQGIGAKGELPWSINDDMKYFKDITTEPPSVGKRNVVIMGRKTWESIPVKFRPLRNRTNVVLTRQMGTSYSKTLPLDVICASSLEDASTKIDTLSDVGNIFLIGGGQIYNAAIDANLVSNVLMTCVGGLDDKKTASLDVFIQELCEEEWEKIEVSRVKTDVKSGLTYQFLDYMKKCVTIEK
jgi:dihydrofolate reductase